MSYSVTIDNVEYAVVLPPHSTALEIAIASIDAWRLGSMDTDVIRRVHRPDDCPEEFLPLLAWDRSVDEWDPSWSVAVKREAIKVSFEIHRFKGTAYAVETAIDALGIGARVEEWFEYGSTPFRFRLTLTLADDAAWPRTTANILTRTALRTKNVRSRLEEIAVTRRQNAIVYVGGYVRRRRYLRVGQVPRPTTVTVSGVQYVGVILHRKRRLLISQAGL